MSDNLKIAAIQVDLVWENLKENRNNIESILRDLKESVDIIVLPEMFTTGFTMYPKNLSETMNGETVCWMQRIAKQKNAALVGSIIIQESDQYYNRLLFVHPSGIIDKYDKKHLFTLAGENENYATGNSKLIVNFKGWKICPLICYDLRFPVWARNTEDYDVLLYIANWPKPRINAWNILLKARAIENMSYCVGVNRVGVDGNSHEYSGNSAIIDSLGNQLTKTCEHLEKIIISTLQKDSLYEARKKLGFLNDRDIFKVQ